MRHRIAINNSTDSQMQGHHAVATAHVRESVRRCNGRRLRIGRAVPCETVTIKCRRIACVAISHGQMQGHHTVATTCVRERVRRSNGRR